MHVDANLLKGRQGLEAVTEKHFTFSSMLGRRSEPSRFLGAGWSGSEEHHTWAVGGESWFMFPAAGIERDCILTMQVFPHIQPGYLERQRLNVCVNGYHAGSFSVARKETVTCSIPASIVAGKAAVCLRLEHPDNACPNDFPAPRHPDRRLLALAYSEVSFVELSAEVQALTDCFRAALQRDPFEAGLYLARKDEVDRETLAKLFIDFQSIGDDCEFGMMQRRVADAGNIGLFRFSSVTLEAVIRGLQTGFADIGAEENFDVKVYPDSTSREYFGIERNYGMHYHTGRVETDISSAELKRKEIARLQFLARTLMQDIAGGHRLLVIKRKAPIAIEEMALLVSTIRKIGPSTVLWVVEAEPGRLPGSVERVSEALLRGYVGWIDVPPIQNTDLASWSSVCVGAHRLWVGSA